MSVQLTPNQIEDCASAFSLFDKDGSGDIDGSELMEVLAALGTPVSEAEAREMVAEVDADKSGSIDFPEFLTMMSKKLASDDLEDEVRLAFGRFDEDGSGFIDVPELQHAMKQLGEDMTVQEVKEMIAEADKDGDGLLSYEDFAATILGK
jgi:calmodulin